MEQYELWQQRNAELHQSWPLQKCIVISPRLFDHSVTFHAGECWVSWMQIALLPLKCLCWTFLNPLLTPVCSPEWPDFLPPAWRWPAECFPGRSCRWWRSWWDQWPDQKRPLCPGGTGPLPGSALPALQPQSWRLWTQRWRTFVFQTVCMTSTSWPQVQMHIHVK